MMKTGLLPRLPSCNYLPLSLAFAMWLVCHSACAQVTELRLKSFGVPLLSGAASQAPVLIARDGSIYGTTLIGGNSGRGTVFRIDSDGTAYKVLHSFDASGADGQSPHAALIQAADAMLYGTTWAGGSNGNGTVFKLGTDGSGYQVIHDFQDGIADGSNPAAGLL